MMAKNIEQLKLYNMKDNKIIAEFMAVPQGSHTHFMIEPFSPESYADVDDLKYDISWDWLMAVIEEIDHTSYEPIESIEDGIATRSLEMTHKAVVEYIKTYER